MVSSQTVEWDSNSAHSNVCRVVIDNHPDAEERAPFAALQSMLICCDVPRKTELILFGSDHAIYAIRHAEDKQWGRDNLLDTLATRLVERRIRV